MVIALALFGIILFVACADDIIVKGPSSLRGVYHGKYIYAKGVAAPPMLSDYEWIKWTFSDYKFWVEAEKTDLKPKIYCDWSGDYKLEQSNITFSNIDLSGDQCDPEAAPLGVFSFVREAGSGSVGDSIKLIRYDAAGDGGKGVEIKIVMEKELE
jgi:hypothetical protein